MISVCLFKKKNQKFKNQNSGLVFDKKDNCLKWFVKTENQISSLYMHYDEVSVACSALAECISV